MDHPTIHPSIHPSVHIDWNRAYHFNTFDLVLRAASFIAARYIARQQSAIFCICVLVNEYYELARVFGCWNLGRLVRHQNASPREFETINTFGYATSCFIHTYEYGYIYANTSWWCRLASLSSWCAICWPTMVAAGQHFAYILSARTGFVANNSHLTIVWWTTITTHAHTKIWCENYTMLGGIFLSTSIRIMSSRWISEGSANGMCRKILLICIYLICAYGLNYVRVCVAM